MRRRRDRRMRSAVAAAPAQAGGATAFDQRRSTGGFPAAAISCSVRGPPHRGAARRPGMSDLSSSAGTSQRPGAAGGRARLAAYLHVHLVSDSTGDTLAAMAKAVVARFDEVVALEHAYPLTRSARHLEQVLREVEAAPGMVIHTIVDRELRAELERGCRELETPCIAALDPLTVAMGRYVGAQLTNRVGGQHALDASYFERIEALDYAIAHDDGHGAPDLDRADVVLVGVSRTSKTPTCIYLAHRGVRAANVPLVPGAPLPSALEGVKAALVVGLVVSPDRLVQIRRNRLLTLREERETSYIDADSVRDETVRARRLFERQGWPVIDVSRRSVEETAAQVMALLSKRRVAARTSPPAGGVVPP